MSRARARRRAAAIAAAAADIVAWANNLDMESGVPVGEGAHSSGGSWQTSTGFTEGLVGPGITQFFNTSMKTSTQHESAG